MDNKEWAIKSTVEETNNTIKSTGVFRGRSSSILKQPNIQNEAKNNPSTRRVSFSSNYIKTFTTDTEKNTIWDTTVEELLSAAESSNSRELHDLNTTLFDGEVDISGQGESESSEDDFSRDTAKSKNPGNRTANMEFSSINVTLHPDSTSSKNSADNSLMEFTCVNPNLHSNIAETDDPANTSESLPDTTVTMDFTCVDPTFHSKSGNQCTITDDSSVSMEFTCVNPTLNSKSGNTSTSTSTQSTTTEDSSISMEFTCVNPTFQLKPGNQSASTKDTSVSMELTCVNPTLNSKSGNQSTITKDSSVPMELAYVNPILHSNTKQQQADTSESSNTSHTAKIQNPGNTSGLMELTCVNPTFYSNTRKKQADTYESFNPSQSAKIQNPGNNSVTMEFTCVNPILHSNTQQKQAAISESSNTSHTAKILNTGNTSGPMELTCVHPTHHSNTRKKQTDTYESFNASHSAKIQNPGNTSVTMEFTCVNPILPSNTRKKQADTYESFNTSHSAKIQNPGNTSSVPMEFTCVNPVLHSNTRQKQANTYESFNASHSAKIQNPANNSVTMEFTCVNPTFHLNTKQNQADSSESFNEPHLAKIQNPGNISVPMEFTCVNPTLQSNTIQNQADSSESFNEPHLAKIQNPGNISVPMEFTCVNPTLNSNTRNKQADTYKSFDASHSAETQNPSNTSVTMEFTCVNPILHSNTKQKQADNSESFNEPHLAKIRNPGNISVPMEFTCVNPTLYSNNKQKQADTSESFNAPHLAKIQNPGNISVPMEFTCVNPTLHSNNKQKQADTSESFNAPHLAKIQNPGNISVPMEFSCVNPTLQSNCNDGKGVNIPMKKSPNFESSALVDISNTAEFLLRNYQDKTNVSNFSMLDCSKGISLMKSVAQTSTQAFFNVSRQIEKDQTVDLPSMSLSDITLSSTQPAPTMPVTNENSKIEVGTKPNQADKLFAEMTNVSNFSMLDCSKGISLINSVAQTSTQAFFDVSRQIEKDQTVDLPSMSLPDITLSSTQPAPTLPVTNGNSKIEVGTKPNQADKLFAEMTNVSNFSMLDCSKAISLINSAAQTSTQAFFDVSRQIEKDQTVDLPSMSLPDITLPSTQPASTMPVTNGNSKIEVGTKPNQADKLFAEMTNVSNFSMLDCSKGISLINSVAQTSTQAFFDVSRQIEKDQTVDLPSMSLPDITLPSTQPASTMPVTNGNSKIEVGTKPNQADKLFAEMTNVSNFSMLDCSKGISLINSVAQTSTQAFFDVSRQIEKDQTVDLPSMSLPDITLPSTQPASTMPVTNGNSKIEVGTKPNQADKLFAEMTNVSNFSMLDCSKAISLINSAAQTSTQAFFDVSRQIEKDQTVDLPSMSLPDITLPSTQPASTMPVTNGNSKIEVGTKPNQADKLFAEMTNVSNFSMLDCSKGISLINSVAQTSTQAFFDVSRQIEKDQTVDLPSMSLPDITLPSTQPASTMPVTNGNSKIEVGTKPNQADKLFAEMTNVSNFSMLDCSKGISLINSVAQTSTQAFFDVSRQIEKDQTVDLPSMSLPDITLPSTQPASTMPVTNGNSKIEVGTKPNQADKLFAEMTNVSNFSMLDCSKGISLINSVAQTSTQAFFDVSRQIEKDQTVDLPSMSLPDITLPSTQPASTMPVTNGNSKIEVGTKPNQADKLFAEMTNVSNFSMLDCSKAISLINSAAQTSTQAFFDVSRQIEKDQTVDLPSMSLPDITLPSTQPASTMPVTNGNSKIEVGTKPNQADKLFAEMTNVSNFSMLDCSKGISLINSVAQTSTQAFFDVSRQIEKDQTVDLPSMSLPDITLPSTQPASTMPVTNGNSKIEVGTKPNQADKLFAEMTNVSNFSMLDCSKGISLINSVAQTSTQAFFDVSRQIEKDQTVDLPSMSLPDITLPSTQPASTMPVTIGNLKTEVVQQITDFSKMDCSDLESNSNSTLAIPETDITKMDCSDLKSILLTQSPKSTTLDLLCRSNIDFSAMSNVDDTMQLLRDASRLNHTKTVNSLNNTSGTQLNRTYLVQDSRLEDTQDSTIQDNNSDMHETNPEDQIDLFSKCAEISGNNYILDRNTIELIENSTDGSLMSASNNSIEQVDIIDDFEENTRPKSVSEKNAVYSEISDSDPRTTEEIYRVDFSAADFSIVRQRDMLILKKKLESIVFDSSLPVDDWKKHIPTLEKLKEQSLRNRQIIAEKYDKFKKQLKDALETCQKNKFVPEQLSEDDEVVESDEFENILPAKRGIVQKIEEKSKICDNSWKMIKMEDGIGIFTSFFEQMEITVEYCQTDYRVSGIETKSLLTDKAKPAGILIQREFLRLLSPTLINNSIGRHYNILSLLDYIQMAMDKIRKCYKTFKDLVATHDIQISREFKVNFFLLDEYLIIKWDFCIDLSDLDKITKDSVSVSASIGKVNAKHVLDLVSQCPKGLGFLENFIMKVKEYLETLKKRKRMLKMRKIQRVCEE